MSSYNYADDTKHNDVLDSVMLFSSSLWMLIFFLIFLFASLMKSGNSRTHPQYLRNFLDRLDEVFAHFIGQNSIDDEEIKALVITLTFFSLMMNQYYNALIRTNLVMPVVPEVPYSYDDFALTTPVLRFPNDSSALFYFKESPEGYPERKLYDEAVRRKITIDDVRKATLFEWAAQRPPFDAIYLINNALANCHVTISTAFT